MKSKVYFTSKLEPQSLIELYKKTGKELPGNIAVKVHSGENGNKNYLRPEFLKDMIEYVNGTVVECNTAYLGARNTTKRHIKLMEHHGWSTHFNVDILDSEEEVILENDLYTYNGDKYIHEKDLYLINLEWDGNTLSDMYYRTQLYITHGSSTVLLNDESFLFPNASVKYNGNYYISMRLIGMFLSEIYEMTDSAISLWITDERYALDFVKGVVSLPDNEVAPAGGITVEVFVTDPDGIAHGGAISGSGSGGGGSAPIVSVTPTVSTQIGQLGYDGIEKPSYDYIVGKSESYVEYEKLVSKDVIIEEGNNSVEFYLSLSGGLYLILLNVIKYAAANYSRRKLVQAN